MFRLTYHIQYEGYVYYDFNTLPEVVAAIKEKLGTSSYDDFEVIEIAREISVNELMTGEVTE